MRRDRFLQWNHWWQMFTEEDHEAQAVELFLSLSNDTRADLLGWLASRSRHTREKIKAIAQEMIQLEAEATKEHKMQQEIIDDLRRQIREMKGLPPLDRTAG